MDDPQPCSAVGYLSVERRYAVLKYVLEVAYKGSHFFGFQRQAEAKTVQGQLEKALSALFRTPIELVGAGRTDTGVHATGQVVAFQVEGNLPLTAVIDGVNGRLSDYLNVVRAASLPEDSEFHPRFSALGRTYRYLILTGCRRQTKTLWGENFWCLGGEFDLERARSACRGFVGEHDFSTFSSRCDMPTMIRRVESFTVKPFPWAGSEKAFVLTVTANAFLRKMVRLLTAGVVEVGLGLREVESLHQKLKLCDSGQAPHPAPPSGLYFHSVQYDPDPFATGIETYEGRPYLGLRFKK